MSQLKVKVYLEDAFTPVNDAKIKLIPLDTEDPKKPKDEIQTQIANDGEVIFAIPANSFRFYFEIFDERFYEKAKNDIVRVVKNYNESSIISLNLLSKIKLYFNGQWFYINNGNKVLDYFMAYSGNALKIEEKEKLEQQYKYENFVSYKDKENNIFYFCLEKQWQQEDNRGAIPEGQYYLDIKQSENDKSSGIRKYQRVWYSKSRNKKGETQWGQYNIPIYTNKECTITIESRTQRNNFYIHGGEKYGNSGGIDLGEENNEFINQLEEHLRDRFIYNPYLKDEPIVIDLLVDYTPLCIRLESIHLERIIEQENQKHKVILNGNYNKPKEMKEEIFHMQKQQTCWGYKEIAKTEEFNFEEIKIKDLILFKKGQKDYRGENLEIDLVKYDWQHYKKQIIVCGFLDTDRSINANGEEIIKNPKWRIITWHNPIVNPRVTLFSSGGTFSVTIGMFGYFGQRKKQRHQALDFFAKVGTKLYAPLDGEVIRVDKEIKVGGGYGNAITLKVTKSSLDILKIRRKSIGYELQYATCDEKNSEIEKENFDTDSKEYYLFYAHLSKIYVKRGDKVVAGQIIGLSGASGNARGTKAPHLHFEIRDKDEVGVGLANRINPAFYIECKKLYNEFSQEEKQEQQEVCGKNCKLPK